MVKYELNFRWVSTQVVMNRWRQSVVEIQSRKREVNECEQAQAALSKVTGCFQQMATSLGTNADGSCLREELEETRTLAHRICTGTTEQPEAERKGLTDCASGEIFSEVWTTPHAHGGILTLALCV